MSNTVLIRRGAVSGSETLSSDPQHRTVDPQADDLLDHFVLDRIGYRARRLAVQFNLDDGRQDDLRQDMVAEVLRAATRFDPTRTTWHTFACRVLDRLVKHIARAESPILADGHLPGSVSDAVVVVLDHAGRVTGRFRRG